MLVHASYVTPVESYITAGGSSCLVAAMTFTQSSYWHAKCLTSTARQPRSINGMMWSVSARSIDSCTCTYEPSEIFTCAYSSALLCAGRR
jgi:hypothetical protein